MDGSNLPEGVLFGMGNPLLDIQARVNQHFLKKWGLKENDAIIADESQVAIFDDMLEKFDVEYVPGGATQNSIRVTQWIWKSPKGACTYTGSIGNDHFGKILEDKVTSLGVTTIYQKHPSVKTGTCACCINGPHRSLVAHLAAANMFTIDHLEKPENKAFIEKAQYYYSAGFFLTVCPDAMVMVGKHACEHNKTFITNLSAPFLVNFFKEPMLQVLPYVDILFGNETEALAFAKEHNFETEDMKQIALKLSQWPKKNQSKPRIVVITQGFDPVVIAEAGRIEEFPVESIPKEQLVDTNGAGDSFVGGFLAQYIQKKPIAECVRCGIWAARVIIQQSGCTFPDVCQYK